MLRLIVALATLIFIAPSPSIAGDGSDRKTPFELGALRGAAATVQTLKELSNVTRWGPPVSEALRADVEGFRRRATHLQLGYGHWGYIRAIKAYTTALGQRLRNVILDMALAARKSDEDSGITHRRVFSPEVRTLMQHYAEALEVLGRDTSLIDAQTHNGVYLLGHEVFSSALLNQSAHWGRRLTVEEGGKGGLLAGFSGIFSKKPLSPQATSDYDAGLMLMGVSFIGAARGITTEKAMTDAFGQIRARRCENQSAESDDGVFFINEEGSEQGSNPDYLAFQAGYGQAVADIARAVERALNRGVFGHLTRLEGEWAQAVAHLRATACGTALGAATAAASDEVVTR